jgi:uncharacterized membrane protein YhaH (DUF805 family)
MSFGEAIASGFAHYVNFQGRAPRSEFWYWFLFVLILSIIGNIVDAIIGMPAVGVIISLGLLLPGISMGIRRLHDLDRTGWWYLLVLTGIGAILLIIWACMKGTSGPNRFGPDPLPMH